MTIRARLLATAAVIAWLAASAVAVSATVFEVRSKNDKPDAQLDGVCADADGDCTLRAAIQEANAHPGEDIINIIGAKKQKFVLKLTGANEDAAATGDLDITDDVIIHGNRFANIVGKKDRVLQIFPGVQVELDGVLISGGSTLTKDAVADPTTVEGGGILNAGSLLMHNGCIVSGNKAQTNGGGIANRGTLTMSSSAIASNKALGDGGGLYNGSLGSSAALTGVTVFKNSAGGHGGGIDNEHTLGLTSATVGGNAAGLDGGGIDNHDGGTATLQNVTLKDNKSKDKTVGGGFANGGGSTASLTNTLVDNNKPVNCAGTVTSGGGNVENFATCGFGGTDLANAGKKLQVKSLKLDKGFGVVPTYELKATSPAIDAGIDSGCPTLDQNLRVQPIDVPTVANVHGSACDSGATEFQLQ